MEDIFLELIQVALGIRECLSKTPDKQEWTELYALQFSMNGLGILRP